MRPIAWGMATIALLAAALPASPQEDPMEVQRCIWRCLADSRGADDPAYHQCVERRCSDEPPARQRKSKSRADRPPKERLKSLAASEGTWTYGRHPKLGLTAYVNVGTEAYGLACVDEPGFGYTAAIRVTKGLVPGTSETSDVITTFSEPFSIASASQYPKGGEPYFEEMGDACTLPITRLRSSKELVYMAGSKSSLTDMTGETVLEYERNGRRIRISNQAELDAVADKVAVPLKGSSKAIGQLVAACPNLRRSLGEVCGD